MPLQESGRELKIGLIGLGDRGGLGRYAHKPDEGVRVVGAADVNERALEAFRENYGRDALVTTNYRELLAREDIDAVFIMTPDFLHEEHAVAALEAGKAVYLEKPMAITVEGCDRILRTAMERKSRLFVGHNMRHIGFVLKMKELIDGGAIGRVKAAWCRHFVGYGGDAYFKNWHADRTKTTGLLLQKAAHDIDVMHWLCGGYAARVNAMGGLVLYDRITDRHDPSEPGDVTWSLDHWPPLSQKGLNPVIDVEDVSMMQMLLDNGVFACYQQCHFAPDAWRNYTFIGTEGRIENFGDSPGECVVRVWNRRCSYNPYGDEQYFMPRVSGTHGGADSSIVSEFLRYVREGGKTTTSPLAARYSVAAGCLATQSLRNGGTPLDVPGLPEEIVAYFDAGTAP